MPDGSSLASIRFQTNVYATHRDRNYRVGEKFEQFEILSINPEDDSIVLRTNEPIRGFLVLKPGDRVHEENQAASAARLERR
jgi:hypothetical protein